MEILLIILGLAIGAVLGWLFCKSRTNAELAKSQLIQERLTQQSAELAARQNDLQRLGEERSRLETQVELLRSQVGQEQAMSRQRLADLQASCDKQLEALKQQNEKDQLHARQLREESDRLWEQKLDKLQEQLRKETAEQLAAKQSSLQESNRQQMDELFKPVKEQFAEFKRAVDDSKTQNQVSKKQLEDSFEKTMRLFQQEHQQALTTIREQTERIGTDAANLTRALKGDSKVQGDWGEMVLETMLENSGLRKGEEYFVQENTKDEQGRNFRPDVVVRFPEGRSVVIDSKVSLTNYADAVACDDEKERERLLREHARSVKNHVDELIRKDYSSLVSDSVGFVLMFIPNETSFIVAMKQQPGLQRYAYENHVIILSPANLLMTLQLVYNLWQSDRQNKNVANIVKKAKDLYDKVVGFEDTFNEVGKSIDQLQTSFATARKQLYDGTGNIMRRVEKLKDLGIVPKKQLKGIVSEETEE